MSTSQNLQNFLDQILNSGKELMDEGLARTRESREKAVEIAKKGEDYLADKLGVDETQAGRDALRKGLGMGAAAGGLALLLTSRTGRKLATIGGLAGLGALAWNAHKKQSGNKAGTDTSIGKLSAKAAEKRSEILMQAMVAAAKVDGEIDAAELKLLESAGLSDLEPIKWAIATTPDPVKIANLADSDQAGREIYAISCRVADGLNLVERQYLDELAMALRIDPEVAAAIETDVRTGM